MAASSPQSFYSPCLMAPGQSSTPAYETGRTHSLLSQLPRHHNGMLGTSKELSLIREPSSPASFSLWQGHSSPRDYSDDDDNKNNKGRATNQCKRLVMPVTDVWAHDSGYCKEGSTSIGSAMFWPGNMSPTSPNSTGTSFHDGTKLDMLLQYQAQKQNADENERRGREQIRKLTRELEHTHMDRQEYETIPFSPITSTVYIELPSATRNQPIESTQPDTSPLQPQLQQQNATPPSSKNMSSCASYDSTSMNYGVPLHRTPPGSRFYQVEFKNGRTEFFYSDDPASLDIKLNDMAIVEGSRKSLDMCRVIMIKVSQDHVRVLWRNQQQDGEGNSSDGNHYQPLENQHVFVRRLLRIALPSQVTELSVKQRQEESALGVCRQRVRARKLPMEIIDAEYQWDGQLLTFYYTSDQCIDFHDLVRDLFKLYMTKIWMISVKKE